MLPKSIRKQLPLTYAAIALVAAISLGAVLLFAVRGYYAQRERDHLESNAQAISRAIAIMYTNNFTTAQIVTQLEGLSFIAQGRIRIKDSQESTIADSGPFKDRLMIAVNYSGSTNTAYFDAQRDDAPPMESSSPPEGIASITLFNALQSTAETVPAPENFIGGVGGADKPFSNDYIVAVAGTPYGFGLDSEITPGRRSDQHVETPLIDVRNQIVGFVELSEGPAFGAEVVDGVAKGLLIASVVAVVVAAGVGWIISKYISKPLLSLTDATHYMAEGHLSTRVDMHRQDEFGVLADSFNTMAARVENTITTLKRFVADAAHELHTPLTAVHANIELAATETNDERRASFLAQAQQQLKRLEVLTNNLLMLSRLEAGMVQEERTPTNLVNLVRETSELYASRAEQQGITFEFNAPEEPIVISINENQVRRVLGNLLDNAIKFTPENGNIQIHIFKQGDEAIVQVKDNGIGIPQEDLPYLFSRFKRGRNAASYSGSGLGLAIIKAIIEAHHGKINVESSPQGTAFSISIPAMV